MRRKLTARETFLLGVLLVLGVVSAYITLFYNPTKADIESMNQQYLDNQDLLTAAAQKLEDKRQMQRELDELFSQPAPPLSIAPFNNLQPLMFELNGILADTQEYDLNFGTVDTENTIVERHIALRFITPDYASAYGVLDRLHQSSYRCMLDGLSVVVNDGSVTTDVALVYFEYQ